jgi:transposase
MDEAGEVRGRRTVDHAAAAVHDAIAWVRELTAATANDQIGVAIETPRGVLVDTLIEQGFAVYAINPKQLERFRDRFSMAGAKDDPRDARVVADALRTDPRAFRRIRPDDPAIIRLRELCRISADLQTEESRLVNRLREQLYRIDAPWLALCAAADEPWLWTMLGVVPHPDAWAGLPRRRIAAILRSHRIRRLSVDDVVAAMQRPRLRPAAGVADAVAMRLAALLPQLVLVHDQRTRTDRDIDRALAAFTATADEEPRKHRDVQILRSLPGVGRFVTATMLTEAAGPLADRDYLTLRAHGGIAPVTKRSGKRTLQVHMRYACKGRLRQALFHWARTSIQNDTAARLYYDRLRSRGHHHARALRSVADRWLRILMAMLKNGSVYDPSRFAPTAA